MLLTVAYVLTKLTLLVFLCFVLFCFKGSYSYHLAFLSSGTLVFTC